MVSEGRGLVTRSSMPAFVAAASVVHDSSAHASSRESDAPSSTFDFLYVKTQTPNTETEQETHVVINNHCAPSGSTEPSLIIQPIEQRYSTRGYPTSAGGASDAGHYQQVSNFVNARAPLSMFDFRNAQNAHTWMREIKTAQETYGVTVNHHGLSSSAEPYLTTPLVQNNHFNQGYPNSVGGASATGHQHQVSDFVDPDSGHGVQNSSDSFVHVNDLRMAPREGFSHGNDPSVVMSYPPVHAVYEHGAVYYGVSLPNQSSSHRPATPILTPHSPSYTPCFKEECYKLYLDGQQVVHASNGQETQYSNNGDLTGGFASSSNKDYLVEREAYNVAPPQSASIGSPCASGGTSLSPANYFPQEKYIMSPMDIVPGFAFEKYASNEGYFSEHSFF